jgi:hypothetical protein
LKTKAILLILSFFIIFLSYSFSDPYTIKRISDENFRYEFYVTDKSITPKPNKVYYWFKGGAIHSAQGGFGGDLLNDVFLKTYHSNQIAEHGTFKNGVKVGIWKTWHPNGSIESTQKWSKGLQTGMYYKYNKNSVITEKGCYENGQKQGKWYDFVKKDTTSYRNGVPITKKQKLSKLDKLTLKLETLKDDANKKILIETEKNKITAAKNAEKDFIKAQEIAIENEKANIKNQKKEAKEAKIASREKAKADKKIEKETKEKEKALKKANKEADINSSSTPKKEFFFTRFFDNLFRKKTSK